MFRHLRFTYSLALAAMALVAVAGEALAQTPEGTVITNTATATYTDANNNPYAAVSGSVSVTVGFKAGVSVTANTPSPSSASPSTADTMTFTVANAGNGTDSMTISENISVAGVITVTGYRYGGTTYATLAALNTALSSVGIAQGGSITLKIVYNVASGRSEEHTSELQSPDLLSFPTRRSSDLFTVANAGNGTDSMTISENISVAGVITVTGYRYGGTTYATLAALNTALSSVGIAQGGSITLKIVYNVASG